MGFFLLSDPPDKYADDDEISPPGMGEKTAPTRPDPAHRCPFVLPLKMTKCISFQFIYLAKSVLCHRN